MTFDKIAAALNALAAVGAALQGSGIFNSFGPTGTTIFLAVLAAVNAVSHALAPPPVK